MLRRVALVRTYVSEELGASIVRVIRISVLGTTLTVASNRRTLRNIPEDGMMMEAIRSSETLVLTTAARRNIPEDGILYAV
jgi:hypothetical protein